MFFVASKALVFLFNPLFWIVGLFLWSFLTSKEKGSKYLRISSFALLVLFTNPLLSNWAIGKLEYPLLPKDEIPLTEVGVVLGGMVGESNPQSDQINLNGSSERIVEGLRLYNARIIRKLIISGGNANVIKYDEPESLVLADLGKELLRSSKIYTDTISRNTHENALEVAKTLEELNKGDRPVLLITSAFHMNRALKCFKKQGIEVVPFPVDSRIKTVDFSLDWIMPNHEALDTWSIILKELIGLFAYQLIGYA